MRWFAKWMVKTSKCYACGKQPKWSKAWGHHSIPWGNGDIWCDERCLDFRKVYEKKSRKKKARGRQRRWEKLQKEIENYDKTEFDKQVRESFGLKSESIK